jgi:hypothetical protein
MSKTRSGAQEIRHGSEEQNLEELIAINGGTSSPMDKTWLSMMAEWHSVPNGMASGPLPISMPA